MKKYLQMSTVALALALVATPAFAQIGSTADLRLDTRAQIRDIQGERKDLMVENKAEINAKFDAQRAEMDALKLKFDAATTPAEKAAIKAEFEASRGEFKADVKTTREENRVEVRAKIAEIKTLRHGALTMVYSAMIERMEKLAGRVSSRIDKLVADGKDATEAKASLAVAKSEIALAKADFATFSTSDEKKNKEIVVSMKTHLKLAHESLVKVLGEVKGLAIGSTNQ